MVFWCILRKFRKFRKLRKLRKLRKRLVKRLCTFGEMRWVD